MFGGPGMFLIGLNRAKTHKGKNIVLWVLLIVGNGMLATLMCREYYARSKYPNESFYKREFWEMFFSNYSWESFQFK